MKAKRLTISTLAGIAFGFVCFGFASSGKGTVSIILALSIITSRTLIGVAIGISRFSCKHWSLHGIIMGLIFSIPAGISVMLAPENPEFSPAMMLMSTIIMGVIYGFLIELITTVLFRARQ